MNAAMRSIDTKVSTTAVATCTRMKMVMPRDSHRWSAIAIVAPSVVRAPRPDMTTPMMTTAVSRTMLSVPVARDVYQSSSFTMRSGARGGDVANPES
ncbi:hypothetical protein [Intrasporangium sp.]|uniref:hypothetical protein n=1 Tax=Intrasporangium sp. TaxID=1925024 RepID=UPI003221C70A